LVKATPLFAIISSIEPISIYTGLGIKTRPDSDISIVLLNLLLPTPGELYKKGLNGISLLKIC